LSIQVLIKGHRIIAEKRTERHSGTPVMVPVAISGTRDRIAACNPERLFAVLRANRARRPEADVPRELHLPGAFSVIFAEQRLNLPIEVKWTIRGCASKRCDSLERARSNAKPPRPLRAYGREWKLIRDRAPVTPQSASFQTYKAA
jgi:hypothetical protein